MTIYETVWFLFQTTEGQSDSSPATDKADTTSVSSEQSLQSAKEVKLETEQPAPITEQPQPTKTTPTPTPPASEAGEDDKKAGDTGTTGEWTN